MEFHYQKIVNLTGNKQEALELVFRDFGKVSLFTEIDNISKDRAIQILREAPISNLLIKIYVLKSFR